MDVTGDTSVTTFDSSGATQLATGGGATTVGGTLGVTGATTLTGALDANGGASIDNVQIGVTGDNEIDTASGNLTIDSAGGTTTIDDDLVVSGTLLVNGSDFSTTISSNTTNISKNKQNINNLGKGVAKSTALTAALTALPDVPRDHRLSCGVGAGSYSEQFALGLGCASRLSNRVDLNFGGSLVTGDSYETSYGSGKLDNFAAKAGFAIKLGKMDKDNLISKNDKQFFISKIDKLAEENLLMRNENKKLKNDFEIKISKIEQLAKDNLLIKNENLKLKNNFESKISKIDALERSNENLKSILNAQLIRLESLEKVALLKNDSKNKPIFSEILSKIASSLNSIKNDLFAFSSKSSSSGYKDYSLVSKSNTYENNYFKTLNSSSFGYLGDFRRSKGSSIGMILQRNTLDGLSIGKNSH